MTDERPVFDADDAMWTAGPIQGGVWYTVVYDDTGLHVTFTERWAGRWDRLLRALRLRRRPTGRLVLKWDGQGVAHMSLTTDGQARRQD